MNLLHFSHNLVRLRHQKKITQEELADFIGVTKASVSKWETGQSLPDIILLPQLAAYFDVTVDELLGYEPQLSKEQIQRAYHAFAADFANLPFEMVMEKSRSMVKQYYSCYAFLFQMAMLWVNHFMLAKDEKSKSEVLQDASRLCDHIISDCKELHFCNDAIVVKALINLQLGRAQEVIEPLEELMDPYRFSMQGDSLLVQAYQLLGQKEKASSFTQISMFTHLISLIGEATQYLGIHLDQLAVCEETIRRTNSVIEAYEVQRLHPATTVSYYLQVAGVYCAHQKKEKALEYLGHYLTGLRILFSENRLLLHGDAYFTQLDQWFETFDLGSSAPRNKKVVLDSAIQTLSFPAFACIAETDRFAQIKKSIIALGDLL